MPNKHVWSWITFRENNFHSLGVKVRAEVGKRFRSYIYEGSFEALTGIKLLLSFLWSNLLPIFAFLIVRGPLDPSTLHVEGISKITF